MPKSSRINVTLVSILTCILLIHSGHARRQRLFEPSEGNFLSSISNTGRSTNEIPVKLQPSWSCILLGETGCLGSCSLMGALYGCEINSQCRKGIYCECNEVYHFQQRDVPAKNFQNLPLDELWNYRFKQTPESKALLTQILKDDVQREYTSNLLRDSHITGEDLVYLLGDEYSQLVPQLQKLVVIPHGLKSEMGINGELEYDNIGDYFSDLFERIKKKVSEKLKSAKSKRRILELIRDIDNEEDLQYILRQILLSGDDKLYNFVSSYLERNGHSFEEESLCQPRRRFGRRRRGCRKRKRCGGGRGGMDFDMPPSGGIWHGRPLKRKIVITHNDGVIKIDADEDEVIEIALINELKKAEENAGAVAQPEPSKKQQQIILPPPNMKPSPEIPPAVSPQGNVLQMIPGQGNYMQDIPSQGSIYMQGIPGQGNTYMQGMPSLGNTYMQGIPSQGNTYMQGSMMPLMNTSSQVPLMQEKVDLYSMGPQQMTQYIRPMSTPLQGSTFEQETFRPQLSPNLQESYSSMSPSIFTTQPTNLLQQETLAPTMQQIQYEILTPPQMKPMPLELPSPTASQYSSFIQEGMPSISMSNAAPLMHHMEEILTQPPQMKPTLLHTSPDYGVMQETIAPISIPSAQNIFPMQETLAPVSSSTIAQPLMHQIEEELRQPSLTVSNEVPIPSYTIMQETLPSMTPETIGNTLSNIVTYNDSDSYPPLMDQDITQSMNLPEIETSQMYSSVKPILGGGNTLSNLSVPSTTTFYADQSPQFGLSQTSSSNSPQSVYKYINSASNLPTLDYDLENLSPPSMSSNYNLGNLSTPKMPSLDELENITPSMSSLSYDFGTPSNMASQSQFQNAMSTPSSSLTSYINQIGLPQNGYSFQSSLPAGLNTSNMEWMSTPSTFSSLSNNLGSMMPQSSWFTQTSNITPQNDILPSTSTSGLSWLQETVPSFQESMPSSQTLNKSFVHEDTPRFIQQTASLSPEDSDEERRVKIPKISEGGFSSSQRIENEIEEVADNFTESVQQASNMLQSEQNTQSNMVSMQQGQQFIPDSGKKKKSLYYMVVDDSGNVVHSASVDHDEEREQQAATQTTSTFPHFSNYFSRTATDKDIKPVNYGWPYWGN